MIENENRVKNVYSVRRHTSASWHKKAKVEWMKNGDENTTIFHASLKMRRIQNKANAIRDAQGNRVDTAEEVKDAFLKYYNFLLGTSMEDRKKVNCKII